jgi:hypothetical protein
VYKPPNVIWAKNKGSERRSRIQRIGHGFAEENRRQRELKVKDGMPFADFLAGLVRKRLAGEPLPAVPKASS